MEEVLGRLNIDFTDQQIIEMKRILKPDENGGVVYGGKRYNVTKYTKLISLALGL